MSRYATISKSFTFDAAHQLPNHDGKCAHLHGHTYKCEVICEGVIKGPDGSSDEGMVVDFAEVKTAWRTIEPLLDHQFLNDSLPADYHPTTAEHIASFILDSLVQQVAQVVGVRLWETPTSMVEVSV